MSDGKQCEYIDEQLLYTSNKRIQLTRQFTRMLIVLSLAREGHHRSATSSGARRPPGGRRGGPAGVLSILYEYRHGNFDKRRRYRTGRSWYRPTSITSARASRLTRRRPAQRAPPPRAAAPAVATHLWRLALCTHYPNSYPVLSLRLNCFYGVYGSF
ncbi:hypothetical protein EVAR_43182_1 [Eumeta japonica]|uniref:Uncharacterized protein n=1 Tax=Eumeta variegata TaxID=151549 RepID=A0A4C1XQC8_EUMVA|nr:hypothetical protein EVAR_43182_1 [Eumeta japonica]